MEGYDKHNLIWEQDAEKRTLHILKKNELCNKKYKKSQELYKHKVINLQDIVKSKFEKVATGKV
jgi:hypothetical protein